MASEDTHPGCSPQAICEPREAECAWVQLYSMIYVDYLIVTSLWIHLLL